MRAVSLCAMGAMLTLSMTTALADEGRDCRESNNHELRVRSCSAIIEADPKGAMAYYNRGLAYQLNGDGDRAISDFNKVIELNPNFAAAYDN